jgi:hypothetical protein
VRRKIYLWKKADIYKIKDDLESFGNAFRNIGKRNIESLWHALKDAIQNTIDKRVPSKMTQGRHTHPWINTTIRRKINRKQKAHKKARKTKKKRDVDRYKRLQQEVQYEVRQANKKYMAKVIQCLSFRCFEMCFQIILDLPLSSKYLLFSIDISYVSLVLA